jgi:hypothetical protein
MKTLFLTCAGMFLIASSAYCQSPTASVAMSPATSVAMTPSVSPAVSPTGTTDLADKIGRRIDKRMQKKGLSFSITDDDDEGPHIGHNGSNEIPSEVIPLVAIVFMTIFGAPVFIVAVIMYFTFSRNRMMHKTIRMMVEKGQPVPPALLAPPAPAQRQRSDMRRGVVLVMVGIGIMMFFGAVNHWEGGAWAIGIIPFLIGAGYLLVWKMEGGQKLKSDAPPPLP